MIQTILSWSAIVFVVAVSVFVLSRRERSFATIVLGALLILCALLEAFDTLAISHSADLLLWKRAALFCEALLAPVFLLFSVTFGRQYSWKTFPRIAKVLLCFSPLFVVTVLAAAPDNLFYSPDFSAEQMLFLGNTGFIFYIVLFVYFIVALVNLETTFRSALRPDQWNLKLTLMGAGSILSLFVFYYSQGLLYRSINMNLTPLRSLALLVAAGLFGYSFLKRSNAVRITISKEFAFRSLVLAIVGGYLIVLGLLGEGLQHFGEASQQVVFLSVLFLGCVFLVALLLSEQMKRKIKVFINKNFFENKFDYRQQWLEFTSQLAAVRSREDLEKAILSRFCDTFGMGGALLFLYAGDQEIYYNKSCYQADPTQVTLPAGNPLIRYMIERQWVFNAAYFEEEILDANRALFAESRITFVVPIFSGLDMIGFIALMRPLIADEDYTYEDYDLMKTLARQAAVALTSAKLSEQLAEVREMEAVGKVTTFIMHDLKNLVYSLSLLTANAHDYIGEPEFQKDLLEALTNTVTRMKSLIAKLKEVPDRHELHIRRENLFELVQETVASLKSGGITVSGNNVEACIDPLEFAKVIENLVINALDATEGNGPVSVEVGGDEHAFIKVADSGCGMTAGFIREHLYSPFKTTKSKGLGIGLYHSRQIVEAHHGRIEVESELGSGSVFTVWIPTREIQS